LAVLPRERAIEVAVDAVSRAAWAVALATILIEAVVLVDAYSSEGMLAALSAPIAIIVGLFAITLVSGFRQSRSIHIAYLVLGAILLVAFEVTLTTADPAVSAYGTFALNRPAVAFLLVSPAMSRPILGVVWAVIGYLTAMASFLAAAILTSTNVAPGVGPTAALLICLIPYVALAVMGSGGRNHIPDLKRLEDDTRAAALEHEYEQRAAAVIHDTVLNDLTVVMNSAGSIDERTRERFRADVDTLGHAAWLRESREWFSTDDSDAALRNGMVALTSEYQWSGLTVDITGNPENEVLSLSPEAIAALHAAVRACLDNVLRHAGTGSAEVVLGAGDGSVTVMVIDHGVGFDPESVPADRLGLRQSVRSRLEQQGGTVRVWSRVGTGTSVLLSIPAHVSVQNPGASDDS
jgi:signal transduction histidine kinase